MSTLPLEATPAALVHFKDEPQVQITPTAHPDAVRYGWSPGQDIHCGDRLVGHGMIPRCTLVPFKTIRLRGESTNRIESAESMYDSVLGAKRQLAWTTKSAYLCLEEMRIAYSQDTPIGFVGFDKPWVVEVGNETLRGFGITDMKEAEAFELYKLCLPYILKPNEILTYLLTESKENIAGADLPAEIEAAAESVRSSMLDGVRQCVTEYSKILEMSRRERAERPGTGKGKPVFDPFDKHIAEMLDELLDAPLAVMAPAPVADPNVAAALQLIAENMANQKTESEEVRLLREQNELLKKQLKKKTSE